MSFETRLSRLPRAFDSLAGQEAADKVVGLSGDLQNLITGTAGSSPYLKSLIEKEYDWLPAALNDPEQALIDQATRHEDASPDALGSILREGKRRVALLTALADIAGVWPLEQVTKALTDFADQATHLAVRAMVAKEIQRGKLPGQTEDDIAECGGLVCLAMGKMGAFELNYSSDIDLICLFDETRYDPDDFFDARASLVRATRRAMALLNDPTGEGYVFRTDLRLRPDPAVTPVCLAMEAAEQYYESLGRTWERAAFIKARVCAGDFAAGQKFLDGLRPFVWRKHLDFAAIEDAHNMRLRIREHKGLGGKIMLEGHNVKLGRGGIREIEFFTQTRQLIAGGRDPDLRTRGTCDSLRKLAAKNWVEADAADELIKHYRQLREVEHRIQMIHDTQTHAFPTSEDGQQRVAHLMGRDLSELRAELIERFEDVHELTEAFFAPETPQEDAQDNSFDDGILERWSNYPALRSDRAVEIFNRLKPELLSRLSRAEKPDEALVALDGFLAGLPAGVQVFSLLEANPQLIDLLTDIAGTSPELSRYLSRNSAVFDGVIGGAFFTEWPGLQALREELAARLSKETDYERKLDDTRRWAKEWHFRIGVHHLRGLIGADAAGAQYSDLAEAVISALWPEVVSQFATKHGPPPGNGAMVLGMGSLGARRLNARSDLDLIVIYDADGVEFSEGRRPLASRAYYARLTQALVTAVTVQMAEGRLYEIDMRLRPSGTQGPVATSLASFTDYQQNSAWTWEHLALTRARAIAGATGLQETIETFRQNLLAQPSDVAKVQADVAEMRDKIAAAKSPDGPWDTKLGAGRLQDIELTAQAAALIAGDPGHDIAESLNAGAKVGFLTPDAAQQLAATHQLCWTVQVASRLLGDKAIAPDKIAAGALSFLLRETGDVSAEAFSDRLVDDTRAAAKVIDRVLAQDEG